MSPAISATRNEHGTTLIEVLISSLLTALIVGGLMTMLTGSQFVFEDTSDRSTVQQAARIGLDRLQRDVMLTGIGLTPMLPVLPLVMPRRDGGIDLRANATSTAVIMSADMTGRRNVFVPNGSLFTAGEWVAIYDALGSIEIAEVSQVWSNRFQVAARTSKNYETSGTAAVAKLSQTSYFLATQGGTQVLMRQVDSGPPQPVAADVLNLQFRYFDDSQPPVEFTPDTPERQLRIRTIDIELAVETSRNRIQAEDRPSFTLRARVVPRALSIGRS